MAQLWGGRFTKQTDQAVKAFNDSIGFDKRLYREDIEGSIAHAGMLGETGIITKEESALITEELKRILDRFLETLPQDTRKIFMRRYFFGDSVRYGCKSIGPTAIGFSLSNK